MLLAVPSYSAVLVGQVKPCGAAVHEAYANRIAPGELEKFAVREPRGADLRRPAKVV